MSVPDRTGISRSSTNRKPQRDSTPAKDLEGRERRARRKERMPGQTGFVGASCGKAASGP